MFSKVLSFAAVGAGFALLALPADGAQDPRAMQALAQAKAAMNGAAWDGVHYMRTKMHLATSGLSGTNETLADTKTGAFVNRYDLGVAKGANGYDGKTVWSQDDSGQVAVQGDEASRQTAINEAYRNANGYWRADLAADITWGGMQKDGKRSFDVVRITPENGRPFDLWIDAKSHLFDRTIEKGATRTNTTLFGDWRAASNGALVAFRVRQTNGEAKYDTEITLDSVTFETEVPPDAFAPPPPPKPDFGFVTAGAQNTTVPFTLVNNHMYVKVMLNGKGPYELLFDTGGSNVITPTVAEALGLKAEGALQASGAGEKSQDAGLARVARMTVGDAFLDNQTFVVIALESFGNVEGRPITGLFGYEVFKRFVVKTDYERSRIVLNDPDTFVYKGNGTRTPFEFKEIIPIVPGEIDGIPGTFQLDTGSRGSIDLMTPFVKKHDLVAKYGAKLDGVAGWGVGGPARAWFVRGTKLTFGGVSVDAPVVGLSQQQKGAFSDVYTAGNIGAGVLKKFNITWDYPHHQIYFERNANYAKPDVFDRAGLWANLGGTGFEVVDVYQGAPAAEAGLQVGDKITAVNGSAAGSAISLPDFRALLRGPVGSRIRLDVVRGTETKKIVITLRELV